MSAVAEVDKTLKRYAVAPDEYDYYEIEVTPKDRPEKVTLLVVTKYLDRDAKTRMKVEMALVDENINLVIIG